MMRYDSKWTVCFAVAKLGLKTKRGMYMMPAMMNYGDGGGETSIFCGEESVVWDAQACEQCQANQVYVGYSGGT